LDVDAGVAEGECTATGVVTKVVYLGAVTRYVVTLDVGGELVVMQQNLRTSSMEALQVRGRRVRLTWERQHSREVEPGDGADVAPTEGSTGSTGPGEEDA
jgi:hypothetical protein